MSKAATIPKRNFPTGKRSCPACRKTSVSILKALDPKSHTTQPPARYTEASLTRTLEEKGIGRPSTYASILGTITDERRNYIVKRGSALVPTWRAFSVTRLMEMHFGTLVDYEFTAEMEDFLDSISRQEVGAQDYLKKFYFGDQSDDKHNVGLKRRLTEKLEEIDPRATAQFPLGIPQHGEHREEVLVRVGKENPFIQQGERTASIPDGLPPDEMNLEKALELLDASEVQQLPIGVHPELGKPIYIKVGRFGPYIQLGEPDDEEKRNQSLLKGMTPEDLTLEMACKLLTLPRTLGDYPENGQPIQAFDGRYGPYVKCEKETRSLPAGVSPLEVTLDEAIALLKQPKTRGRAAPKEPLKVFEEKSPITEGEVKVLDGRFGPYVTDGETNASLPKGSDPKELKFNDALDLLAERAARAPTKRKKKGAKKKTAKKGAVKKKATKKKTAKKKGVVKKKS